MTREQLQALAESRHRKTWRGKDLKKLCPIPWTARQVVFTCSNGWTLERIERADAWLEGLLMGHCLGLEHGRGCWYEGMLSLRDERGIPHATLDGPTLIGRCNGTPPDKYWELVKEYDPHAIRQHGWGLDEDVKFHEDGVLQDRDYRDMPGCGAHWKGDAYREKRGESAA